MSNEECAHVVVEVTRLRCGQNVRVEEDAYVAEGPAYVRFHTASGSLASVCNALVENGHTFTVRFVDKEISMLEWAGEPATEPDAYDIRDSRDYVYAHRHD